MTLDCFFGAGFSVLLASGEEQRRQLKTSGPMALRARTSEPGRPPLLALRSLSFGGRSDVTFCWLGGNHWVKEQRASPGPKRKPT